MTGIASAATSVVIGYLAGGTRTIRVGSGGVMLPNHAPLHVAESFRLLEALHPGRIDLGIGRAPGTDGRTALEQKRVDAWAGLDPLLAASELEAGTRIIYRNVSFNTYGFLNTTEKFAKQYPEAVERTVRLYGRARYWIQKNPEEAAKLLADEAKISIDVAKRQLARTGFDESIPGQSHRAALKAAAPILIAEGLVKPGTDVAKVVDELVTEAPATKVALRFPHGTTR